MKRQATYRLGIFALFILLTATPFARAGQNVCADYPSRTKCIAELREQLSHYTSEVEVWWQHLSEDLGKKAASRVQAAHRAWQRALHRKCGVKGHRVPKDEKTMSCLIKGMYDCLWTLRDAVFRLENGQPLNSWPPCASR